MFTLEQVLSRCPDTKGEEWHKVNDAWVHRDAQIGEKAEIRGGIIRGGTIWGGTIRGGIIKGGAWKRSPLQIEGTVSICYHAGPGLAGIGCEVHPIEKWFSDGFAPRIAYKHNADFVALEGEYRVYMEMIRKRDAELFPPPEEALRPTACQNP